MPLTETLTLAGLFKQLLRHRDSTNSLSALGPWLKQQIQHCSLPSLHQLPFEPNVYTRNCIAREFSESSLENKQCFEALVMRWDKNVETAVHGHPDFAFYYVISGVFKMEFFSLTPAGDLQRAGTRYYDTGDTICFTGQAGRYDNTIHRVTCLEPGLTFHVYSEDAQKGCCYELLG